MSCIYPLGLPTFPWVERSLNCSPASGTHQARFVLRSRRVPDECARLHKLLCDLRCRSLPETVEDVREPRRRAARHLVATFRVGRGDTPRRVESTPGETACDRLQR